MYDTATITQRIADMLTTPPIDVDNIVDLFDDHNACLYAYASYGGIIGNIKRNDYHELHLILRYATDDAQRIEAVRIETSTDDNDIDIDCVNNNFNTVAHTIVETITAWLDNYAMPRPEVVYSNIEQLTSHLSKALINVEFNNGADTADGMPFCSVDLNDEYESTACVWIDYSCDKFAVEYEEYGENYSRLYTEHYITSGDLIDALIEHGAKPRE